MTTSLAPPELAITTVRTLAIDAVEKANSGHPGAPMGLAPVAWTLFSRHLRHSPTEPEWPDRDRFVLSAGHASALLYALLHLTGYDLPLDELKRFRQLGSRTPGHPERGDTPGVEITTGPLGQGFANSVGFALAEAMLAARFNRPGHEVVSHRTWFICSDGDLMEGISHEAASIAGFLRLERLIGIYDDNHISLDGPTSLAFAEDVPARFAAYGWRVLRVDDGNDLAAIERALSAAEVPDGRPTLIVCRTHIGYGAPHKQDTSAAHGSPLGPEETAATKRAYGWPETPTFLVPDEVAAWRAELVERGRELAAAWRERLAAYAAEYPAQADGARPGGRGPPARGLGARGAALPRGRVDGHAGGGREGPERLRRRGARAGAGRGRPLVIDQHDPEGHGGRGAGRLPRPQPLLRGPRARDGRDHQRHRRPRGAAARLLDLLHVLGLHEEHAAARRPDGPAVDLRLHPRLRGPGRGRSHPPAHRAPGGAAGHPPPRDHPARPTPARRPRRGGSRSGAPTRPPRWC